MDIAEEVKKVLMDMESDISDVSEAHAELMGKLDPYINDSHLGLATTIDLIHELNARVDTAHLNGEEWPVYHTVQGE